MSPTEAAMGLSNKEVAGYLMWYCGSRACASAYAWAAQLPEVYAHLTTRTEARYTPAVAEATP